MRKKDEVTPMMRQYAKVKAENPDCLVLFRLGDFYELFEEDAKIGSEILGIVLTSRDGKIPMAGVPYHALDQYLSKLVNAGYKVAICEQLTPPDRKTIVERAVVRIVTPGTILDENSLQQKENNYFVAIEWGKQAIGLAVVDLSTGEFRVTEFRAETEAEQAEARESCRDELARLEPVEGIISPKVYEQADILGLLHTVVQNLRPWNKWDSTKKTAAHTLQEHWKVATVEGFGISSGSAILPAAASALHYLQETQKSDLQHIRPPYWYSPNETVMLDRSTVHNLELFHTLYSQETEGSLLTHIDRTKTAAGGRLLRQWVRAPLREKMLIESRQKAVAAVQENPALLQKVQTELQGVGDIERILSRLSTGLGNPRDLIRLRISLEHCFTLEKLIENSYPYFSSLSENDWKVLRTLHNLIQSSIVDEPPLDPKTGGVIREGMNPELDELRNSIADTQSWILRMEQEERQRTGIPSLKIRSNKVFGFYIEVTTAQKHKVPDTYERKQTLVNGERFITPELKEKEALLLTAEEEGNRREYEFFQAVVREVLHATNGLQLLSKTLAELDCFCSFAALALAERYVRPTLNTTGTISITNGRHPVVEKLIPSGRFVPNDTHLGIEKNQIIVLTGPNMAGKSVYMRQVALIVLLAHIGSYVPATKADICLVDRIFVRSGAADIITAGLSTFMLEMVESATILRHATEESLVIMDEIGRGTSTYDGISLAWSIAEFLVTSPGKQAKTLFATHYHELQALAPKYPERMKNMHLEVKEEQDRPVFLYRLAEGGASHSFGIAVAKLAGVPEEITSHADRMLSELEAGRVPQAPAASSNSVPHQIQSEVLRELSTLDLSHLTPLEALNLLAKWKETK